MVEAEALIYTLAGRLQVVEEDKVGNTPAKLEWKAVQTFDTLSDTVAENEVDSLGDTQMEVNGKALDYQMADWQADGKVDKLGDISQRR